MLKKAINQTTYVIEDKYFGKLKVKRSANAWWMDRGKVERLIMGYKMDCRGQECRFLAGISEDQLKYFKKIHPEFSTILDDMRSMPSIKARTTIMRALDSDPATAKWWLERKHPDEFKERKDISRDDLPILIDDIMNDEEI